MPASDVPPTRLAPPGGLGGVLEAAPDSLVHITLNVGDADTQLMILPADGQGRRGLIAVDVIKAKKLIALIDGLHGEGVLGDAPPSLELVVATHPHADHIRGIPTLLDAYAASRPEVWEPGYRHASPMYLDVLDRIAAHGLRRTVVSAGTSRFIGQTRLTVLAPGVSLQRRFDSYGVDVNNASVCLKVEYPATRVVREASGLGFRHTFVDYDIGHTLILGADAQMLSWSQVLVDFPQLGPINTVANQAIRAAGGTEPLKADVFKIPHHGSKHGLTLELVETIRPKLSIVSSGHSGGAHQFPHEVAMAQLREAVNARAKKPGDKHDPDEDLAVLYTGSNVQGTNDPAGSVCTICGLGDSKPRVWRLMDGADEEIKLQQARRVV